MQKKRVRRFKIPWIFKFLHKPNYKIGPPEIDLSREDTKWLVFALMIIVFALLFGGIFLVTYEYTPPLLEVAGRPAPIYPGFSRETLVEFFLVVSLFIMATIGGILLRIAPRRAEEEISAYIWAGLLIMIIVTFILAAVFAAKAGLLRR